MKETLIAIKCAIRGCFELEKRWSISTDVAIGSKIEGWSSLQRDQMSSKFHYLNTAAFPAPIFYLRAQLSY